MIKITDELETYYMNTDLIHVAEMSPFTEIYPTLGMSNEDIQEVLNMSIDDASFYFIKRDPFIKVELEYRPNTHGDWIEIELQSEESVIVIDFANDRTHYCTGGVVEYLSDLEVRKAIYVFVDKSLTAKGYSIEGEENIKMEQVD